MRQQQKDLFISLKVVLPKLGVLIFSQIGSLIVDYIKDHNGHQKRKKKSKTPKGKTKIFLR